VLAAMRVLRSMLYGASAPHPLTFVAVAVLVTTVALVASYTPARRALRIDSVEALRAE
jgi:putative ABC transport system permease protein